MALLLAGCHASPQATAANASAQVQANNEGYSLLYDLLAKQQDVGKSLWLRKVEPDLASLIKEIAEASSQGRKQLEAYARRDPTLQLGLQTLPEVERQTRDAIEATETTSLLGSHGAVFQLRLLLTQANSMQYASHLAKVLSARETQESRKAYLRDLAKQLDNLNMKVIDLLAVKAPR